MISKSNDNHNHLKKAASAGQPHSTVARLSGAQPKQQRPDRGRSQRPRSGPGLVRVRLAANNFGELKTGGVSGEQMLELADLFPAEQFRPYSKGPTSRSALRCSCETCSKMLLLLLAMLLVFVSLVAGNSDESRAELERLAHNRARLKANNVYYHRKHSFSDRGLERPHGLLQHRSINKQQNQNNNNEQQDQLRYLIAKTASIPQLEDGGNQLESSYQPHRSHHHQAGHAGNQIVNYHDEQNHPNSVQQRTSSEPSVTLAIRHNQQRRKLLLERAQAKSMGVDSRMIDSLNRPNSHYHDDFDSLDADLDDDSGPDDGPTARGHNDGDDDGGDNDDDDEEEEEEEDDIVDDAEDDDLDVAASGDIDVVKDGLLDGQDEEENDGDREVGANSSGSLTRPGNDGDNIGTDQGEVAWGGGHDFGRRNRADRRAKTFYSYSSPAKATTEHRSNGDSSRGPNATEAKYLLARDGLRLESGDGGGGPNRLTGHDGESFLNSDDMVRIPVAGKQGGDDSTGSNRQVGYRRRKPIQPLAPYQSPVVVSISDNSFVSASPITMGSNDAEGFQVNSNPNKRFGEATIRYSHIIASPKNELSLHGKRHWHESHIQMIQEDPDELRKGNINSAIIAILFGIGATGMLIMIVSVKMRSIRERVAYKGRRRSLVPDTDFLINTIPI